MEVESGEYINPEKMTFSSFVEIWTKKFVQKNLEETTAYNYSYQVDKRMIPYFGDMQLDKIKTLHLTDYMDKLAETVGDSSQVYNYRILRSIFSKAVAWKVLKTNPMDGVDKPKEQPKEMNYYNEKEIAQLLAALESEESSFKLLVLLALTTGMRRGELLGLEWKHIDLEQGIIDIKQTIPMFKDGEPVLKGPKRSSSIRKIVIPSSIVEELKQYQKHMAKERLKSEAPWEGGDHHFLFAGETGPAVVP
ncbi:tyrosine-type recombinase/integrase [Paenibacillus phocaensis]|uniref:tyrosine-type recombinase/integrase n=1 Tax=Paenibacillus phocaensis TaxID=1776378 RepID=UPI000A422389|nr:site-specific integrase [Paenibacillus phocaensis]